MVKVNAASANARGPINAPVAVAQVKESPACELAEDQTASLVGGRLVGNTTKPREATYSVHMTARRSLKRSPAKNLTEELQQPCARSQRS